MAAAAPTPHGCDDRFDAETCAVLQLSLIRGLGPALMEQLLSELGTARGILSAPRSRLLRVPGVGHELANRIQSRDAPSVADELARCREHHVSLMTRQASDYPRLLTEIHDPPSILYYRGDVRASDALAVAVIGTRRPSRYGIAQAERLATSLAHAGITVASGLARGIDAVAHRAAIRAGGRTFAVLAGGLLQVYPPEHRPLADQVAANGALISEVSLNCKPRRGAFPRRNRLISGLALGIVVVEAKLRSGALITAGHALDQGRDVFAIPGRVDSATSRGCHQLLRDGARLVENVDDVLDELGPLVAATPCIPAELGNIREVAELRLNDQERTVLAAIDDEATRIEAVVVRTHLPVHRILATLSVLEMRRLIERPSGDVVRRK